MSYCRPAGQEDAATRFRRKIWRRAIHGRGKMSARVEKALKAKDYDAHRKTVGM